MMLDISISDRYISDTPWQRSPVFAFNDDASKYEEAFRKVIESVPETENRISFKEDVWDFRPFFKDINSASYRILFANADDDYKDYLKFFVIYLITRKTKISTISSDVVSFISLISSIKKFTNHNTFSLITTEDIIDEIENRRDVRDGRCKTMYCCAHKIYSFIKKNYKISFPVDIPVLLRKC